MKTFIFIFISIVGFFFFLFTYNDYKTDSKKPDDILKSLEEIELAESIQTIQEVHEYTSLSKEIPKEIPEEQVFDTIKSILVEASNRIYTQDITLSTRVNSILYTKTSKDQFKEGLAIAFNLNLDEVEKQYPKNKLVWDWVNQLKE